MQSSTGTYAVVCGNGVLSGLGREIARLGDFSGVHIVTSSKVWTAVGKRVMAGLRGSTPRVHNFSDKETAKNLHNVELIARNLIRAGADRKSVVIAVGGGVVGDVAGFAAACYLRGVALVQVPTTVVSQTDSAIGGKTGVNLPEGKNLVGAFYSPRLVLADSATLKSLSHREFRGGLAEIIKYGVIADARMFAFLETNFEKLVQRDAKALQYVIARSIEIKADVVGKDERELDLREILNFGHTFGHALESVTGYKRYQHGEAVAWGMISAALYGHELGITPAKDAARIIALTKRLGNLPPWPTGPANRLIELMRSDKKARAGKLRFVLSPKIGTAKTYDAGEPRVLESVLRMTAKVGDSEPTLHG